jgi:hypothetical protein
MFKEEFMNSKLRVSNLKLLKKFLTLSATSFIYTSSFAVSLDQFSYTRENLNGNITTLNSGRVGETISLIQNFAGAFGGTRSVQITAAQLGGQFFNSAFYIQSANTPSAITFNNSLDSSGSALISYDGDNLAGLTDYDGLCSNSKCLDLKEGNATGLNIGVSYDLPFNIPMELEFTFYDSKDQSGNTYSRGSLIIDKRYNDRFVDLFIPFASLTKFGLNGAANLSNIGAFSIGVKGDGLEASDLGLTNFRTNGSASVPEPTTIGLLLTGILGMSRKRKKI